VPRLDADLARVHPRYHRYLPPACGSTDSTTFECTSTERATLRSAAARPHGRRRPRPRARCSRGSASPTPPRQSASGVATTWSRTSHATSTIGCCGYLSSFAPRANADRVPTRAPSRTASRGHHRQRASLVSPQEVIAVIDLPRRAGHRFAASGSSSTATRRIPAAGDGSRAPRPAGPVLYGGSISALSTRGSRRRTVRTSSGQARRAAAGR